MTRFTHREIEGRWYTWDELTGQPVSAGKKLEISVRDRATLLNSGGQKIGTHYSSVLDILADFDRWASEYGQTDPVIARLAESC